MTKEEQAAEKAAADKKALARKELKAEILAEVKAELKKDFEALEVSKGEATESITKSKELLESIAEAKAEAKGTSIEINPEDQSDQGAQETRRAEKLARKNSLVKFKGNGENPHLGTDTHEVTPAEAKMFKKVGWGKTV